MYIYLLFDLADPPGPPGVPQYLSVKDGQIDVTWTPPEDDGGSPITHYVLEYRVEGQFKWITASPKGIPENKFLCKGLNKDDMYEFRVAAVNRAGQGPYSDSSTPVKAMEPIGKILITGTLELVCFCEIHRF